MILPMVSRCAAISLAAILLLPAAVAAQDTTSGDILLGD
jgi:hypothetical protein